MPIALTCTCGREMRIKEEFAGRKVRCPDCQGIVTVPQPGPEEEEVLTAELHEEGETRPGRSSVTARRPRPRDEEDEETGVQEEPRRRRRPADDDEDEAPRPKRKPRPRIRRDAPPQRGGFGTANAGIVGGLIMMLLAVVWFVGGLMVNIIFFYPPILFIIGLIAFIKGLTSR